MTVRQGVFRVAPMTGETTWSLIGRVAARYGLDGTALLSAWQWQGHRPRHDSGAQRADAEVLLDAGGRRVLAGLCGVSEGVLGRALPAWSVGEGQVPASEGVLGRALPAWSVGEGQVPASEGGGGRGLWRVAGSVVGPAVFGCGLCAARRCGVPVRVVRYARRWERVCVRHGRWLLDADADQGLEFLDVRGLPEVAAAQRRWVGVARRAVRAGVDPQGVFGVASAVVCRWWEQALEWKQERVWPARLHTVAGGDAGGDFWRWRVVGRDAVVFPETVSVAEALLDPVMAELAWRDGGGERPQARALPGDGAFCARLGERVGRPWLGPLVAVDYGGPLVAWMGAVIRRRRGHVGAPGWEEDPWRVRREQRPASIASQLRVIAKEQRTPGSGTSWRSTVPGERRMLITDLIENAADDVLELRGAQTGSTVDAARRLLEGLSCAIGRLEGAVLEVAAGALAAGVGLGEVAEWAGLPAELLANGVGVRRGGV